MTIDYKLNDFSVKFIGLYNLPGIYLTDGQLENESNWSVSRQANSMKKFFNEKFLGCYVKVSRYIIEIR